MVHVFIIISTNSVDVSWRVSGIRICIVVIGDGDEMNNAYWQPFYELPIKFMGKWFRMPKISFTGSSMSNISSVNGVDYIAELPWWLWYWREVATASFVSPSWSSISLAAWLLQRSVAMETAQRSCSAAATSSITPPFTTTPASTLPHRCWREGNSMPNYPTHSRQGHSVMVLLSACGNAGSTQHNSTGIHRRRWAVVSADYLALLSFRTYIWIISLMKTIIVAYYVCSVNKWFDLIWGVQHLNVPHLFPRLYKF